MGTHVAKTEREHHEVDGRGRGPVALVGLAKCWHSCIRQGHSADVHDSQ
jgi:hypothetical protein